MYWHFNDVDCPDILGVDHLLGLKKINWQHDLRHKSLMHFFAKFLIEYDSCTLLAVLPTLVKLFNIWYYQE